VSETEQYENVCKGAFDRLFKKLDRIDTLLRGDIEDSEKPGLVGRVAKLQDDFAKRQRFLWVVLGACVSVAVAAAWKAVFH
jgi:hypothetical protein